MKKTIVILSVGIIGVLLMSFAHVSKNCERDGRETTEIHKMVKEFETQLASQAEDVIINPEDLTSLEAEEDIDLGFDTAAYLPLGFNAYEGYVLNPSEIEVYETEEDIDLGFDTADYLPANFNAYLGMELTENVLIHFMEEDPEIQKEIERSVFK